MPADRPGDSRHCAGVRVRPPLPLALRLYGSFEAHVRGRPLPRLRSRKGAWLLALLALRPDREVERSLLAGYLWPESPEPQAQQSLRKSLKDLRAALGEEASRLESPTRHTLRLNCAGADLDVVAFDAAIARGDAASLEAAAALYGGPLLEGCAEEWILPERVRREEEYLRALEQRALVALAAGDPADAARHLRQAVALDPLWETAQRELIRALARSGEPGAAIEVYRDLRLRLYRELNAEPSPETTLLFQQVRAEARERASLTLPPSPLVAHRCPPAAGPTRVTNEE